MTYIPISECRHGWTYKIHSRNLILGVFNSETKGFVGIREKFGDLFLFTESHCDTGAPHGTVHPEKEIEECPIKDLRESFAPICFKCKGRVEWIRNDKHGPATGDWEHVADVPEGCTKSVNANNTWGSPSNQPLFDYLENVEKKIQSALEKEGN